MQFHEGYVLTKVCEVAVTVIIWCISSDLCTFHTELSVHAYMPTDVVLCSDRHPPLVKSNPPKKHNLKMNVLWCKRSSNKWNLLTVQTHISARCTIHNKKCRRKDYLQTSGLHLYRIGVLKFACDFILCVRHVSPCYKLHFRRVYSDRAIHYNVYRKRIRHSQSL